MSEEAVDSYRVEEPSVSPQLRQRLGEKGCTWDQSIYPKVLPEEDDCELRPRPSVPRVSS